MTYQPPPNFPPTYSPANGVIPVRRRGKLIALFATAGVVLIALIVLLVILPAVKGDKGSSPKPTVSDSRATDPVPVSSSTKVQSPVFAPIVMGGTGLDQFFSVAVAPDGGVIAVGSAASMGGDFPSRHKGSTSGNDNDALIAMFSPDGTLQWAKTMGGTAGDTFYSVAIAPDGSIVAAGATVSIDGDFPPAHGDGDALLAVFSPDGALRWAKTMGGTGSDRFAGVTVTPGGTIIAVGATTSDDGDFLPSHGNFDGLIAMYSSDGTLLWAKTMGGRFGDLFTSVAAAPDGSVIAAGVTYSDNTDGDFPPAQGDGDALLAMFNPDGAMQWVKTMGGGVDDSFNSVVFAPNGDVIAAGFTASTDGDFPPSQNQEDALLARYSPDGTLQWAKTGGDNTGDNTGKGDLFMGVATAQDGSIIAAGTTKSLNGGANYAPWDLSSGDALLVMFSPDGTMQWSKSAGGNHHDCFYGVAIAHDGGLIAAGITQSTDGDFPPAEYNTEGNALLAKFSLDGTLLK